MMHIITPEEANKDLQRRIANAKASLTVADYNRALEDHMLKVRTARGYDTREPSDYKDSAVPRWAADALAWIRFRDTVMLWALEQLNAFEQTGVPPCSLEDFKAHLEEFHCEWPE